MIGRIALDSSTGPVVKRGLLWQQRDRIFSRWKERYFVLTRDYLQCFKRASGSVNERISDMGQFIFKIKLVDVEKVEWLNRRSYSAISLFLGREGRVLLRTDTGLEDWFELLEECTLISKERRHALRITQGPRSRASLAALPCHSSFQTTHSSLGATYNFQLCDSVPDLSGCGGGGGGGAFTSSTSSAPRKIPIKNGAFHMTTNGINNNNFLMNGYSYGTPLRIQNHNKKCITTSTPTQTPTPTKTSAASTIDYDNDDNVVQLRRRNGHMNTNSSYENNANDKQNDWMYRRPNAPNDIRHSLLTDIDISACDSGLDQDQDTPPSTHRPSSYREPYYMMHSARDSTDTGVSSSRGTLNRGTLVSPKGSFRTNHENGNALRRSVQENLQQFRNEKNRYLNQYSSNKMSANDYYDPNQNKYHKLDGTSQSISSSATNINHATANNNSQAQLHSYHHYQQQQHDRYSTGNGHLNGTNNNNCNTNGNMNGLSSAVLHPALLNIMNDAQAMKFRDRSFSDIQQKPRLIHQMPNNNSSSPRRRQFSAAQSRI
ncbi:GATA zinc finger domain-containing protein 14 isoform X2 [Contarinia nasturtii]|nr:GATA zinc finger domain-containing protein 14 isoform X2 [Contarinia nasturtii]